jgi:cysteine synthase
MYFTKLSYLACKTAAESNLETFTNGIGTTGTFTGTCAQTGNAKNESKTSKNI